MIQARSDFLLALEDSIRSVDDASQIIAAAASSLGWHLHVNRCAYAEVELDQDSFNLTGNFTDGVGSIVGRYRFASFGDECLRMMRAGQTFVVEDSETDRRVATVRDSYRDTAIRAVVCVPLLKRERLVAAMAVHQAQPRQWQADEVELVQQVASRCWESIERARISRELQELNEVLEERVQERTGELVRSERYMAQLVNGITDCAIYMLDPDGRVTSWNPGAVRIKGYEANEIIGREFSLFYASEDVAAGKPQAALKTARTRGKFEGEGWRVRKDGTKFWASVLIDPIYGPGRQLTGYAKITRDMTDRQLMQEQLNQAQKMEAIGQLTGGVAHDFNNLLTVILGNLDVIYRHVSNDSSKVKRAAEHAMRGAEKAASLTHQLLAFSRQQSLNPKPTDINRLVTGLLDLIRRLLPEAIAVESRTLGGVGAADVDPNQLESALLNLAVNARDAISGSGRLTFSTEAVDLDAMQAYQLGELAAGAYIVISVSDTGSGMPGDVMARAFEPFFTTKPIGSGTGLGLSQVFGFVKQSGGQVRLLSEVGNGTTVKIYLPRCKDPVGGATMLRQQLPAGTRNETLLVVEDEPDVRSYTTECLEELGFSVLAASEANGALELFAEHSEIKLLITDVGLPGTNGRELADQIRLTRPDLPVVFMSGYARDRIFHEGRLAANSELLTKPFSRVQLAKCVRALLDRVQMTGVSDQLM